MMQIRGFWGACCVVVLAGGVTAWGANADSGAGVGEQGAHAGAHVGEHGATAGAEMHHAQHFRLQPVKEIVDEEVRNPQGEKLGKIKELAVDADSGRVAYAVLDFGGFLGMGDKYFAIPWTALQYRPDMSKGKNDVYVLNVDKDKLKSAPGFDKKHWPDFANNEWATNVNKFYGQRPYWEQEEHGNLRGEPIGNEQSRSEHANRNEKMQTSGERHIVKADKDMIGSKVYDQNSQEVGEVQDLLVDRHAGHIGFVVVDFKNNANVGADSTNRFAAIPWSAMHWNTEKMTARKEKGDFALKVPDGEIKGQLFSKENWPDLTSKTWAENTYKHYNQRPYWEGYSGMRHMNEGSTEKEK